MSSTTKTYSNNVLTHRNPVNLSNGVPITENTTILVRLAPDTVTLDIPFNRVTTWNRLIRVLYEIYTKNNPKGCLTLEDAKSCIQIRNDQTGGIIIPELWYDFIKPQVRIAAEFHEPFLSPPWHPDCEISSMREEEDFDMMEGVLNYQGQPRFGGYIEAADWRKHNQLICPPLNKLEDSECLSLLPAPMVPTTSFTFTSFSHSWSPMEGEKPRLRNPANLSGSSHVSGVLATATMMPRGVSQEPTEAMRDSASPPPVTFRNPFPSSNLVGSPPAHSTLPSLPQRFTPVRQVPADSGRTPSYSPEFVHQNKENNPRPAKRRRNDDAMASSPDPAARVSKSPRPSSESNGTMSRAQSLDIESPVQPRPVATPSTRRRRTSDAVPLPTVVVHQKILLLDSINAGEMIKIIRTKDGDLIAIRDDEEPEGFMERRQSNASFKSLPQSKKEKEPEVSKTAKKRALDDAQTEELIRIWSGCGTEPAAKRPKANQYDKLTVEHKHKILKFVVEQHIIRIDHFTNPVIQDWKARTIPDADQKQTEEYIGEIAANKFNDNAKRKEAYRLFMEQHNHCHKSSPTLTTPNPC
ncbi:hypothetical protein AA313_de0205979 [Arthrobotrys entomopaga]|nr:hypothetical protein AA313_de0205979 [Arthrobotrys entomopaga]